jgi:hypothetical protein
MRKWVGFPHPSRLPLGERGKGACKAVADDRMAFSIVVACSMAEDQAITPA